MLTFLTKDAIAEIKDNADTLVRVSNHAKLRYMKPTTDDHRDILNTIVSFVQERRRIVYGGYAINSALSVSSPEDMIYAHSDSDFSIADIEFYSPEPIQDTIHLCNILKARKQEYVRGKEAMHNNTFTISVEFVRECDVTFVPAAVYYTIPHMLVDKAEEPQVDRATGNIDGGTKRVNEGLGMALVSKTDLKTLVELCGTVCAAEKNECAIVWTRYHQFLEILEERVEGCLDGRVIITLFGGS
eukprot:gene14370-20371_t